MEDKDLIKYINGSLSRSEREDIVSWIEASNDNFKHYASLKADYVFANLPDTVKAEKKAPPVSTVLTRVAAALLLPVIIGAAFLYGSLKSRIHDYERLSDLASPQSMEYLTEPGVKGRAILPDGTLVSLNSCSKLVVPASFSKDKREVFLDGEGYFDVVKNPEWPMYIRTSKGFTAKVYGTSFNLTSYTDDADFRLALYDGCVNVEHEASSAEIKVEPQTMLCLTPIGASFKSKVASHDIYNASSWKEGILVFDDTPMQDVVKRLERWYGVSISINDAKINSYRITATFESKSLECVLNLIKISSNIDYSIHKKQVAISLNRSR